MRLAERFKFYFNINIYSEIELIGASYLAEPVQKGALRNQDLTPPGGT